MSQCLPTAQNPRTPSLIDQIAEASARQKATGFSFDDKVCPRCHAKHWGHSQVCDSCQHEERRGQR